MVLLANGNGKEKIFEELVLFMNGPEITEHFVLWLFSEVERLLHPIQNENENEIKNIIINTSNNINNQFQHQSVEIVQETPLENISSSNDIQMTGNPLSSTVRLQVQGTRNFSRALESALGSTSTSTSNKNKNNISRDNRSRDREIRDNRVNRFKSPEDHRDRDDLPRGSVRRVIRRIEEDEIQSINSNISSGGKVQKLRLSVDFDRDEQRRGNKNKNFNFKKLENENEDKNIISTDSSKIIKVKCQFWPNCRAGADCPNVHPSETCKHFPNCQFGDDCTFVHPSIPCKFQEKCQNSLCNYQHRAPISVLPSGTSTIQCRFYPRCVNANCSYLHPVKVQCRYGVDCSRPDCPFEHQEGRKGAHLKKVVYAPCKYGQQCAKTDCPYQHEITENNNNINNNNNNINNNNNNNTIINPEINTTDMIIPTSDVILTDQSMQMQS